MFTLLSVMLAATAALISVPIAVFFVEVVASLGSSEPDLDERPGGLPRGRIAVVVPAHNESSGVLPTIEDIKPQLSERRLA